MTTTQDAAPGQAALVAKHAERLDAALAAIAGRGYWSAYPESPSPRVYGEGTAEAGKAAFEGHLGQRFLRRHERRRDVVAGGREDLAEPIHARIVGAGVVEPGRDEIGRAAVAENTNPQACDLVIAYGDLRGFCGVGPRAEPSSEREH